MTAAAALLVAVAAERAGELLLARRNTRALLARGAIESGAEHYGALVALHAAWLTALWLWGRDAPLSTAWLALFLALQATRLWVIATLGARWTTRIIVLPGAPLVTHGPYRILAHPNYAVVIGEIAVLPLALGLPEVALAFSLLNLAMLAIRVRAEMRALSAGEAVLPTEAVSAMRKHLGVANGQR